MPATETKPAPPGTPALATTTCLPLLLRIACCPLLPPLLPLLPLLPALTCCTRWWYHHTTNHLEWWWNHHPAALPVLHLALLWLL